MDVGDVVKWRGVNRIEQGTITEVIGQGNFEVEASPGRIVIVNERSVIE